ncbi:XK-related protein 9 isoform X6 [Psammomys obesus]|uniref:XK-related protein 9 isoform X6 n=1 Tax=Psammomys obesus TaxID=48139 RepID=UPI002453351E|nr:XK-related protein 9 isoform X6 [Psammomys obesus]
MNIVFFYFIACKEEFLQGFWFLKRCKRCTIDEDFPVIAQSQAESEDRTQASSSHCTSPCLPPPESELGQLSRCYS